MATQRRRITFVARKRVSKAVKVSFRTSSGKRVSFTARRQFPRREVVTFRARKHDRRRK